MIARQLEAGSLRRRPHEHAILEAEIGDGIELFARNNHADNGLAAIVQYLHVFLVEGNLHAFVLYFVIYNGCLVNVSAANGIGLRLDDKEVLQRLGAVHGEGQVGQVVAKLHRLGMYAISPAAKHRHLRGRVGSQGVACITEVFEGEHLLRPCGAEVLGNTTGKQELAAMRVVHEKLDGAQRTIVLADDVCAGSPRPCVCPDGIAVLVGTEDEAFVLPAVAPRVGNNPGSDFVLFHFAHDAVAVEVELNAVVVAANGKGMVEGVAPCLHVFLTNDTCFSVSSRTGYGCPSAISCDTDASHAAAMHRLVAAVVVEPFLELLSALGGIGRSHGEVISRPVPHGAEPLVVALHPSVVGVVVRLCTEESAVGASTISGDVGDAGALGHSLGGTGLVGHQPCEVRGILVLGERSIGVAIAVYLVRELIADASSRATGTAILIEDGREIFVLPVIDERRQGGFLGPARPSARHIVGRLGLGADIIL